MQSECDPYYSNTWYFSYLHHSPLFQRWYHLRYSFPDLMFCTSMTFLELDPSLVQMGWPMRSERLLGGLTYRMSCIALDQGGGCQHHHWHHFLSSWCYPPGKLHLKNLWYVTTYCIYQKNILQSLVSQVLRQQITNLLHSHKCKGQTGFHLARLFQSGTFLPRTSQSLAFCARLLVSSRRFCYGHGRV